MPHQQRALEYALSRTNPALFMDMRLGKTLTTIRWVQELPESSNILVVAPLSVLETWREELLLEGENNIVDSRTIPIADRDNVLQQNWLQNERTWYLISYQLLLRLKELAYVPWDAVILDESTAIKNPKAQITQLCVNYFRSAKRRCILSGLPNPESDLDFYSQFKFLDGKFLNHGTYWSFRFNLFQQIGYDWIPKRGTRELIKSTVHERAFILRRSDVIENASRKIYERRYVNMNSEQLRLTRSILKDYAFQSSNGEICETTWMFTAQTWLRRIAGGLHPTEHDQIISYNKIDEIVRLLQTDLAHQKIIIWVNFIDEGKYLHDRMKQIGFSSAFIHGDVSADERAKIRRLFTTDNLQIYISTEACGMQGIDLSVADTMIYYSNAWSCEQRIQSEQRFVHPKKHRQLLIIDLITRDTVDEEVSRRVRTKAFNATNVLIDYVKRVSTCRA
jgi:SNF2 family DNA or RNA helicase